MVFRQTGRQGLACALSVALLSTGLVSVGWSDGYTPELRPINTAYNSTYNSYNTSGSSYYDTTGQNVELRGRISTLPKGTSLLIRMDEPLSSAGTMLGQSVSATLENDVYVQDAIAIPAGSEVVGQVSDVSPSGRLGKHGEVDVRFHTLKTPTGTVIPIRGHVVTQDNTGILRGNSYGMDIVKGVGIAAGGTGIGAVAGTALGGILGVAGTGAAMGTGIGAIAGISYALARKGKDVVIPSGSRLSVVVDDDVPVNN